MVRGKRGMVEGRGGVVRVGRGTKGKGGGRSGDRVRKGGGGGRGMHEWFVIEAC